MFFRKEVEKKFQVIDIHGHYAYGIDDGAKTKEEFIRLVAYAKENGVTDIVLTPHIKPGRMRKDWFAMYDQLFEEICSQNYGIYFHRGCELLINDLTIDYLLNGEFFPIAEKYLLVEFNLRRDFASNKENYFDLLYEISIRGYIPIIAHCERYFYLGMTLDDVIDLRSKGYLIQINLQSLIKNISKKEFIVSKKLLKNNLVDFIASDTHSIESNRLPEFKKVLPILLKIVDENTAKNLLSENARIMLKGGIL